MVVYGQGSEQAQRGEEVEETEIIPMKRAGRLPGSFLMRYNSAIRY